MHRSPMLSLGTVLYSKVTFSSPRRHYANESTYPFHGLYQFHTFYSIGSVESMQPMRSMRGQFYQSMGINQVSIKAIATDAQ